MIGAVGTVIQLLATVGAAAVLVCQALWSVCRQPLSAPATQLSEGVLFAGYALFLNVVYPWFRLGLCARSATIVLLLAAALVRGFSGLAAIVIDRAAISMRAADLVMMTAGLALVVVVLTSVLAYPTNGTALISSPFAEGVWYVAQGGASPLVNHHFAVPSQRYSLDLVRLDSTGRHLAGIAADLDSYPAWGSSVVAPASARVVSVVDGLADQQPGVRDSANPAGNHIVLEMPGGLRLLLCHLRCGSITVEEGQRVEKGYVLGEVGNSGNTSEPHLHIQAVKRNSDGEWVSVPINIQGKITHRGQLLRHGR